MTNTLIAAIVLALQIQDAPTPWSEKIASMWQEGKYNDVLEIARDRLKKRPNDLVGLLLKYGYDATVVDVSSLPGALTRLKDASSKSGSKRFKLLYPQVVAVTNMISTYIASATQQQLSSDREKAVLKGKSLPFYEEIQALERDGFVPISP